MYPGLSIRSRFGTGPGSSLSPDSRVPTPARPARSFAMPWHLVITVDSCRPEYVDTTFDLKVRALADSGPWLAGAKFRTKGESQAPFGNSFGNLEVPLPTSIGPETIWVKRASFN